MKWHVNRRAYTIVINIGLSFGRSLKGRLVLNMQRLLVENVKFLCTYWYIQQSFQLKIIL